MTYTPTTRKPTGIPAAPLVMVSGLAKSGKSSLSYLLAYSKRIDNCWVCDLGEGSADEYGGLEGDAPYEILNWGTSWTDLEDTVRWCCAQKPKKGLMNALIIDSGTELWFNLSARAHKRARSSKGAVVKLKEDPDADIDTGTKFWNDAKTSWASIISPMKLAPNLVGVVIVRQEIVSEFVNNAPTRNKVISYQCEKTLQGAVTHHVNVNMDHAATLIEARGRYLKVEPGAPGVKLTSANPLDELLGLASPDGKFQAPDVRVPVDDQRDDPEMVEKVKELFEKVKASAGTPLGDALKKWADGRSLNEKALADIDWFVAVREFINEYKPETSDPPLADVDRENSEHNHG